MERLELEFYYGKEAEQFTFYRLPKALITDPRFKDISNNAKLLYGLMFDRMSLSARSGWFDDENRVFIKYALKSIMEDLNCSKMTAVGLLKELQGIGLIDVEQRNGLANIIYVKNFVSESKSEELDRSKNCTSPETVQVAKDQSEIDTTSFEKNFKFPFVNLIPAFVWSIPLHQKLFPDASWGMTFGLCALFVVTYIILSFLPLITVVPCVAGVIIFTAFAWAPADLIGNNVARIIVKGIILVFFILLELCVWINSTLPWLERKFPNGPNIRVIK